MRSRRACWGTSRERTQQRREHQQKNDSVTAMGGRLDHEMRWATMVGGCLFSSRGQWNTSLLEFCYLFFVLALSLMVGLRSRTRHMVRVAPKNKDSNDMRSNVSSPLHASQSNTDRTINGSGGMSCCRGRWLRKFCVTWARE